MSKKCSCIVVINCRSGTVRSRGVGFVRALIKEALSEYFQPLGIVLTDGDVGPHVEEALRAGFDVVIAGGGDGTIATAAALVMKHGGILGALPLGTMNLFVRALGFSGVLEKALEQLQQAQVKMIDVGVVNNKIFLHQVSFGVQPRLARLREKMGYRNRFSKIVTGLRALLALVAAPRPVRVNLLFDQQHMRVSSPLILVSNNMLGAKHDVALPHRLDEGVLGLYVLQNTSPRTLLRLVRSYLGHRLEHDDAIEKHTTTSITIKRRPRRFSQVKKKRKALLCSVDGEVVLLKNPAHMEIRPKALRVLVPG
jgi:diacylglycerol kinase family enzyme